MQWLAGMTLPFKIKHCLAWYILVVVKESAVVVTEVSASTVNLVQQHGYLTERYGAFALTPLRPLHLAPAVDMAQDGDQARDGRHSRVGVRHKVDMCPEQLETVAMEQQTSDLRG